MNELMSHASGRILWLVRCAWCLSIFIGGLWGCSGEPTPAAEGDACQDIGDCGGATRLSCLAQTCQILSCTRSTECPEGAACVEGFCEAPECLSTEDCDEGALCFEGDCREDLCTRREECGTEQVCRGTPPRCLPPPEICEDALDCPIGQACKLPLASCVPSCTADASCVEGTYCDGRLCRNVCEGTADCDPGEFCTDGRCRAPRDCSGEPRCPPEADLRDPTTCACVECLEDTDCLVARQEACVEGICRVCEIRAEVESVCTDQDLIPLGGCCLECLQDTNCATGELCEGGRCIDVLEQRCQTDADCRENFFCDGYRCTLPASLKPCGTQAACPEGEACYGDGRCRVEADVCGDCPAPSRCVAEVGDREGTCAGCTDHCSAQGCGTAQLCYVPEGGSEGWCVDEVFWQGVCR